MNKVVCFDFKNNSKNCKFKQWKQNLFIKLKERDGSSE
jgi:hypothetical protein